VFAELYRAPITVNRRMLNVEDGQVS
jgi:hypothetical protein